MKRIIRDTSTGEFLACGGEWSRDLSLAMDLSDFTQAIQVRSTLQRQALEYVLVMPLAADDVTVPLFWPFALASTTKKPKKMRPTSINAQIERCDVPIRLGTIVVNELVENCPSPFDRNLGLPPLATLSQ